MAINLNSKEGRKKLLEELQKRLEFTINEFNEEITEAFSMLKKRDKDRKAFFKDTIEEVIGDNVNPDNKTLWEKKLEEIENNK